MAYVESPEKTRQLAVAASSGRSVVCKVLLLDGTTFAIDVDKKAVGLVLFDKICDHLDLLEKDYFGLNFIDPRTNLVSWLDLEKKISKQMKDQAWHFNFEVKFYPTDVHQLHEDLTRYQLCLQIRKDVVNEKLPCSFVTYSLLGSYTVQSELGDWEMEEFGPGIDYIKDMKFAPHQDRDLLKKIVELHKTHKGQTPEEAELHFLDNAKKLGLYGVHLHDAKDGEGVDIQIGICASGITIYKDKLQINRFVWPKVVKMSYRRNKFYIKLRPGEFEDFQSMIAFKLLSIRHSKRLWKIAVEHHSFFRFKEAEVPRKRGLLKLGSRFRYSGRTLYQSKMAVTAIDRPMPNFDRIHSKRATYGGRPNKRHEIDDYYSRPVKEPKPRPPRNDDHYIDRRPEDSPPVRRHESDNEDDEDPIETKSRMEKMHGVPTPLALMNKDKGTENNNEQSRQPKYNDDRPERPERDEPPRREERRREPEEDMVRTRIVGRRARHVKGRQPMYGFNTNHKQRPLTLSDSYLSQSNNPDFTARKTVSFQDNLNVTATRKQKREKIRYYSKKMSANKDYDRSDTTEDRRNGSRHEHEVEESRLSSGHQSQSTDPLSEDVTGNYSSDDDQILLRSSSVDFQKLKRNSNFTRESTGSYRKKKDQSRNVNDKMTETEKSRVKRRSYVYDYSSQSEQGSLENMKNQIETSIKGKPIVISDLGYKSFMEGVRKGMKRQSSARSLRSQSSEQLDKEPLNSSFIEDDIAITENHNSFPVTGLQRAGQIHKLDVEKGEMILLDKYKIMNNANDNCDSSSADLLDISFSEDHSFLNGSLKSNASLDSQGRKTLIKTNGSFHRSLSAEVCQLKPEMEKSVTFDNNVVVFESPAMEFPPSDTDTQGVELSNVSDRSKIKTCPRLPSHNSWTNMSDHGNSLSDILINSETRNDNEVPKVMLLESNDDKDQRFDLDEYAMEPRRLGRKEHVPMSEEQNDSGVFDNSVIMNSPLSVKDSVKKCSVDLKTKHLSHPKEHRTLGNSSLGGEKSSPVSQDQNDFQTESNNKEVPSSQSSDRPVGNTRNNFSRINNINDDETTTSAFDNDSINNTMVIHSDRDLSLKIIKKTVTTVNESSHERYTNESSHERYTNESSHERYTNESSHERYTNESSHERYTNESSHERYTNESSHERYPNESNRLQNSMKESGDQGNTNDSEEHVTLSGNQRNKGDSDSHDSVNQGHKNELYNIRHRSDLNSQRHTYSDIQGHNNELGNQRNRSDSNSRRLTCSNIQGHNDSGSQRHRSDSGSQKHFYDSKNPRHTYDSDSHRQNNASSVQRHVNDSSKLTTENDKRNLRENEDSDNQSQAYYTRYRSHSGAFSRNVKGDDSRCLKNTSDLSSQQYFNEPMHNINTNELSSCRHTIESHSPSQILPNRMRNQERYTNSHRNKSGDISSSHAQPEVKKREEQRSSDPSLPVRTSQDLRSQQSSRRQTLRRTPSLRLPRRGQSVIMPEDERPIDIPTNHAHPHAEPPPHDTPFKLLSKEEQKRQQKEEKERIKRAKEEEKRRKKEEEKERKRLEKERKSKKGKEHIGQEWDQAVTTAVRTEVVVPPDEEDSPRPPKRLSSFEESKERLRKQLVTSLHQVSDDDGHSDRETEAADDNDDSAENDEVTRTRVGEEFEL